MTQRELTNLIRNYRGTVYIGMLCRNDVAYVKVVKADLLVVIANVSDNELTATERNGALYVESAI